jgi:signal transduction histidine kinase
MLWCCIVLVTGSISQPAGLPVAYRIPTTHDSIRISRWLDLAREAVATQRTPDAFRYFDSCIHLAQQQDYRRELSLTWLAKANLQEFTGQTTQAAETYLLVLPLLQEAGQLRAIIGLYTNLNSIHAQLQQQIQYISGRIAALKTPGDQVHQALSSFGANHERSLIYNFPDRTLVKEVGQHTNYVIFGGARFAISTFDDLFSYGSMRDIRRIPQGMLALIPEVPRDGTILREFDYGGVFIMRDSVLHMIDFPETLELYGGWDAVCFVPSGALDAFPKSDILVTKANMDSLFNYKSEVDFLGDALRAALATYQDLQAEWMVLIKHQTVKEQRRKAGVRFALIGSVALMVIVVLLIRNARQRNQYHQQSLQAMEREATLNRHLEIGRERNRIAADLHDDLGSGLSRIRFLAESMHIRHHGHPSMPEEIDAIRQHAPAMIESMNNIIWALDERNNTLEELIGYIRAYAAGYLTQHQLEYHFNVPEQLPEIIVKGELRRNIFLCVKECLHNIVRHARATRVSIDIMTNQSLFICIRDNGMAFVKNDIRKGGHGLGNMQRRMEQIGGRFAIMADDGTRVDLEVPLAV